MTNRTLVMSRRLLLGTTLVAGVSAAAVSWRRSNLLLPPDKSRNRAFVRAFGAVGDGRTDDTAAFQAAHDSLPGGGVIIVEPGTYRVSRMDILHRHIAVELADNAIIRKFGSGGPNARGIFTVENLLDADFMLRGGTIDLNGEGPMAIGVPGRLPNIYAPQTVPTVRAIAGPLNAAVFGLRASGITISNVNVQNTGETGILLRNCGDTLVEGCNFRNIANYGVEWSLLDSASDGGQGAMPARSRNYVRGCGFEDLDDYGLGSGNGAAVGGGGAGGMGRFTDYSVTDCSFLRCQRDINFEFGAGTSVERIELRRLRSQDARQGGFGLVGARDVMISDYLIVNPGYGPTSALGANWPSVYGGSLSSDFDSVTLSRVEIIDQRGGKVTAGPDGEIAAGTRRFRSKSAKFTPRIVGTFLGVREANPEGVCYVGRVVEYASPTEVILDLPAAVTVKRAAYAYGGACREGLRLFHGTSATLENCRIQAGTHSGLPGEPPSAGVRIERVADAVECRGLVVMAPATTGSTPTGIDLVSSSLAGSFDESANQVGGFTRNLVRHDPETLLENLAANLFGTWR